MDGKGKAVVGIGILAGFIALATRSSAAEPEEPEEKGTLIINSDPVGASIKIDGEDQGITPGSFELNPGTYQIIVNMTGYDSYSETVIIGANTETTINAILAENNDPPVPEGTFLIHGVNIPEPGTEWCAAVEDSAGNFYDAPNAYWPTGDAYIAFTIPEEALSNLVNIYFAVIQSAGGVGGSDMIGVVNWTKSLTVRLGNIYKFDLTTGNFI
jgi:hypothetical protein